MRESLGEDALQALFVFDRRARDLFSPHRRHPAMKALDWCGDIGDQPQLRAISIGLFALGVVRSDPRMMRAGVRMLASHELATFAKNRVKHQIDRHRPRSTAGHRHKAEPRAGRRRSKEVTSFPSGHSAGALAVACAFAAEYPEHRTAALAAAGAVGAAQVPTCAHYPSDVVAGWTIGAAADSLVGLAWGQAAQLLTRWR